MTLSGAKKFRRALCLLLSALFLACVPVACKSNTPAHTSFFAMDTVMDLTVYGDTRLLNEGASLVYALEHRLSVTDVESEIYALNELGGAQVSEETAELIKTALSLCEFTRGALDITVYPAVRAWGFTTGEYRVPDENELASLLPLVDYKKVSVDGQNVTLPSGAMLDLGAVAKGYASDRLKALLTENGVKSAVLNLGGNVLALGQKPDGSDWAVAIADPKGDGYACILRVCDRAVITSGGYQRYFEKDGVTYRHIIDPKTARPVDNGLASVTVIGESGVTCDALSTALYVMGLDRAIEFYKANSGFEAVFITEQGDMLITEGLETAFSARGRFEGKTPDVIRR